MASVIFSKSSDVNNSIFGKSQEPVRAVITQGVESFEAKSLLSTVYSGAAGLAKCGAAAKPTHIVMGPKGADGRYPAISVLPTTVFETESTAAVPASAIGSAVTLHTDGLTVTATTTNGVFTVSETENAAGGRVRGRFI